LAAVLFLISWAVNETLKEEKLKHK
jgi:hypothetical protein